MVVQWLNLTHTFPFMLNSSSLISCHFSFSLSLPLRLIVNTEGPQVLFKGLTLSLGGSVPTRAIYFCAYSNFKKLYNGHLREESPGVHLLSAVSAGELLLVWGAFKIFAFYDVVGLAWELTIWVHHRYRHGVVYQPHIRGQDTNAVAESVS